MSVALQKDRVSVGRSSICDIRLINKEISRIHFELVKAGSTYVLVDKSKNGTKVNDKKVKSWTLFQNDKIYIPGYELTFTSREKLTEIKPESVNFSESQIDQGIEKRLKKCFIYVLEGSRKGEIIELENNILFSRGQGKYLFNDKYISKPHARILFTEQGVLIEDLGSKNGTYLNNVPIKRQLIEEGDIITMGQTSLRFHGEYSLLPGTTKRRIKQENIKVTDWLKWLLHIE